MKPSFAEAARAYFGSDKKPHCGCAASFLVVAPGWGLKLYGWEVTARTAWKDQARAAALGLAPEVGEFGSMNGLYGYVTEAASYTVRKALVGYETFRECTENNVPSYSHLCWLIMENDSQYVALVEELNKHEFSTYDLHADNVAFMPDGRLVMIDFDR